MRFVIVTGLSGAGKTTALKVLEDANYFCVDNLPIPLIDKFVALTLENRGQEFRHVALGVDARNGQNLGELGQVLGSLKASGCVFEILFLDAEDQVLIKRYKETRRSHPLAPKGPVDEGIRLERERLSFLRARADYVLDTSYLLTRELKENLRKIFVEDQKFGNLMISVLSFGFKYGIPSDADLVFDVRFLPNPFYIDELRPLTGEEEAVFRYVMEDEAAGIFACKLEEMVEFLIPHYIKEGKNNLVIAIGCTGGKHRSVALARELYHRLSQKREYGLRMEHRDIEKDALRKRGV